MSTIAHPETWIRARVPEAKLDQVKRLCLDKKTTIQAWLNDLIDAAIAKEKRRISQAGQRPLNDDRSSR